MITDPWFYVVAVIAIMITGISKGGFGGGLGTLAVPLMSLVILPQQAAAIMLPLLCSMDIFGFWTFRGTWDKRNALILISAAMVGIALGAFAFRYMDAKDVKLMVGLVAVVFTLYQWGKGWIMKAIETQSRQGKVLPGLFWGAMAGFTSTIAHAGGPPVNIYLLPQHMDRTKYVGTTVLFFLCINYTKLIPYYWLGQFHVDNLMTSLVLFPLVPISVKIGAYLHSRVSDRLFYILCYWLLFGTGLKLLWDGLN